MRIAKILESWKQLLYPVAMTTNFGKYLGARLRWFFGPRGVSKWVDNSFIATWREASLALCMASDAMEAGFISLEDKGLWWLLCQEK